MGVQAAQKKLGVLGGMGPAASADFLRILAERAPATIDQEQPIVYVISDPQIPDRTCAIFGRGSDPSARIKQDLLFIHFLCSPLNFFYSLHLCSSVVSFALL